MSTDLGIAWLSSLRTRRWLGKSGNAAIFPAYDFFPWLGQRVDSPPGQSWNSDDPHRSVVTKSDTAISGSWAWGANYIGETLTGAPAPVDVLYVSYGTMWVNIVWPTVKAGANIQIWSQDGATFYQNWTATGDFIVADPGGHVAVAGGTPLIGIQATFGVLVKVTQ